MEGAVRKALGTAAVVISSLILLGCIVVFVAAFRMAADAHESNPEAQVSDDYGNAIFFSIIGATVALVALATGIILLVLGRSASRRALLGRSPQGPETRLDQPNH